MSSPCNINSDFGLGHDEWECIKSRRNKSRRKTPNIINPRDGGVPPFKPKDSSSSKQCQNIVRYVWGKPLGEVQISHVKVVVEAPPSVIGGLITVIVTLIKDKTNSRDQRSEDLALAGSQDLFYAEPIMKGLPIPP